MPAINTGVCRTFVHGGLFQIKDGATTYDVGRITPGGGSLTWTPGLRELKYEANQGTLMTAPMLGDEQPTKGSIEFNYTNGVSATELYGLMVAYGSNGLAKTYEIVITVYNGNGATAGETITFSNVVFEPPTIKAGAKFDTISASFLSMDDKPTIAATP